MTIPKPKTLEQACVFVVDCLHKTAPTQDSGYPLIRTPNIGKGRLNLENVFRVSEEVYQEWTRRATPEAGDLILAREAPAGNVAIVKEGQQVCLGQRTVHLRPDRSQVDPDFLVYYLLAPKQQAALLSGQTGATAQHVNVRDIRRLPLNYLPTFEVQKRIGPLLAAYDDLIENNRRRIQLLEESARLVYREWFVHLRFPGHEHVKVVDGVPEGWERKPLGDLTELRYGRALKEEDRVWGPYPVYGSSGEVGTHDERLVEGPGIVVGRKGNVGSVYWVYDDFWPIDTVYYVEPEQVTFTLYYALLHATFVSSDAAVPGLNRKFAYSRTVLWPDERLRSEFEDFVSDVSRQISNLISQNGKLAKARDLLLPRLMNGEIAV